MEISDKEIPFLYIFLKQNCDKIWIDNYFKPTDTCRFLHCKKNIPFRLAQRICTIVENQQQKLRHLSELKENLEKKYDYPVNIITNGIKKALKIPQNELKNQKKTDEVLPFISTFNPNNPPVFNTQLRIPLKSMREMFQDLTAPNLLTVSDNHITLRNC